MAAYWMWPRVMLGGWRVGTVTFGMVMFLAEMTGMQIEPARGSSQL